MSHLKQQFGRRIAQLREQKGLTQEQLAEAVNCVVRTIQHIESGDYGTSFDMVERLAAVFGCQAYELFQFEMGQKA